MGRGARAMASRWRKARTAENSPRGALAGRTGGGRIVRMDAAPSTTSARTANPRATMARDTRCGWGLMGDRRYHANARDSPFGAGLAMKRRRSDELAAPRPTGA